jgi:hypothetical protein
MRRINSPNYVKFGPTETVVTFAKDRGELRRNDTGEFFFRELSDGKFTCAAPDLERQLINAGVRAGVPIGITRTMYNRCVTWKVRAIGQVAEIAPAVRPSTTSKPKAKPNGFPERLYSTPEPPAHVFPECEPVAAKTEQPKIEQPKPEGPNLITRCMRAAVEAAADATAHGKAIGYDVAFGAPEIEALAVTLYIRAQETLGGPSGYRRPNGQARSHYNGNAAQKA